MNVGVVVGKRDDGLDADGQQYRDLCFHLRGPRLTSEGRKTRRQEPLVQDGEVVRVRGHWHMKGEGVRSGWAAEREALLERSNRVNCNEAREPWLQCSRRHDHS